MTTVFLQALIQRDIGTSSTFEKEAFCLGLCFTDGNIWPSNFQTAPRKCL